MEKVVSIKHLQDAGLLNTEYTDFELHDAFLVYWISNNKIDNSQIILRDGAYSLDIDTILSKLIS